MTIREIMIKYENAISEASDVCVKEKQEFLKENQLDGMVKRIEDGKIGWFIVGYQRDIVFYPMKKDGTRSLNSGGWFNEDRILDLFEPYDGGDAE